MRRSHTVPGRSLNRCRHSEATCINAVLALPASEVGEAEAHIAACPDCRRESESLRPVIDSFVSWPTDLLRPSISLQERLVPPISGRTDEPALPRARQWSEPEWEQVAPGIECKLLAGDYNCGPPGPPGASDFRVWSETGCTCLLVTSTTDALR